MTTSLDPHLPPWRLEFEEDLAAFFQAQSFRTGKPYWFLVLCAFDAVIGGLDGLDHAALLKLMASTHKIRATRKNSPALVAVRVKAVRTLLDAGDLARAHVKGSA